MIFDFIYDMKAFVAAVASLEMVSPLNDAGRLSHGGNDFQNGFQALKRI